MCNFKIDDNMVNILVPAIFALIGIVLGNYISNRNANLLFITQKKFELRHRSYSKIMGLRVPLIQTIQMQLEAKILTEYYHARYIRLSNLDGVLEQSKSEYKRAIELQPTTSSYIKELYEAIGEVSISYNLINSLESKLNDFYNFQFSSLEIKPIDMQTINSEDDLENYKQNASSNMYKLLHTAYDKKIKDIIEELDKQLRQK